jgi:hypothetical protein
MRNLVFTARLAPASMNFKPLTDSSASRPIDDLLYDLDADKMRDLIVMAYVAGRLKRACIKGWRRRTGLSPALPKTHMDL